jgi:hypothetical protein
MILIELKKLKVKHRDLVGFQKPLLGKKLLTQNALYKERMLNPKG